MDPSPKANYPGIRVLQNDSTVEKLTGIGVILSRIVGNLLLDPGPGFVLFLINSSESNVIDITNDIKDQLNIENP